MTLDERIEALTRVLEVHSEQIAAQGKQIADQGKQIADQGKQIADQGKQIAAQGEHIGMLLEDSRTRGSDIESLIEQSRRGKEERDQDAQNIAALARIVQQQSQSIETLGRIAGVH